LETFQNIRNKKNIVTQYDHLLSNASEISFPLQRIATDESLPGSKPLNTDIPVTAEEQLSVRGGRLEVIKKS
jgi:hypothetical protein